MDIFKRSIYGTKSSCRALGWPRFRMIRSESWEMLLAKCSSAPLHSQSAIIVVKHRSKTKTKLSNKWFESFNHQRFLSPSRMLLRTVGYCCNHIRQPNSGLVYEFFGLARRRAWTSYWSPNAHFVGPLISVPLDGHNSLAWKSSGSGRHNHLGFAKRSNSCLLIFNYASLVILTLSAHPILSDWLFGSYLSESIYIDCFSERVAEFWRQENASRSQYKQQLVLGFFVVAR